MLSQTVIDWLIRTMSCRPQNWRQSYIRKIKSCSFQSLDRGHLPGCFWNRALLKGWKHNIVKARRLSHQGQVYMSLRQPLKQCTWNLVDDAWVNWVGWGFFYNKYLINYLLFRRLNERHRRYFLLKIKPVLNFFSLGRSERGRDIEYIYISIWTEQTPETSVLYKHTSSFANLLLFSYPISFSSFTVQNPHHACLDIQLLCLSVNQRSIRQIFL